MNHEQCHCLKSPLVQISMFSLRAILIKNESMSKLPMKLLESWSKIPMAKLNKSLMVYLLVVNDSKIGTKNLSSLCVDVCKADEMSFLDAYVIRE